jgi:hypothetical protein
LATCPFDVIWCIELYFANVGLTIKQNTSEVILLGFRETPLGLLFLLCTSDKKTTKNTYTFREPCNEHSWPSGFREDKIYRRQQMPSDDNISHDPLGQHS